MFGKILMPCSDARIRGAMRKYIECEQEVREADKKISVEELNDFHRVSVLLWAGVLNRLDGDIYEGKLIPQHGPGATADRLKGNRKYDLTEWPERLERVFPHGDNALANLRFSYLRDRIDFLEPGAERPVRVISVPKTLKTPRVIAIEPTAMQYMQQAIKRNLYRYIEQGYYECSKFYSCPAQGMIGFDDQIPNHEMARIGSLTGALATLDLSEASDRVSNQHVRTLLRNHPQLNEAVDACRSRKADVAGHGVVRLAKFASMGSALTFPIEAMVFLTLVFVGIERVHKSQLTRKQIMRFRGKVRVYGDDIIVPVEYTHSVVSTLESFGYKVNTDKSFWNGKFRESCGKEYFDGHDVSICRVRRSLPARLTDVQELISTVSLRNQLYFAGLWNTARELDTLLERILVHYPAVMPTSPALGRHSHLGADSGSKWDDDLHVRMVRAYVPKSLIPKSSISGEGALLKCLLSQSDEPVADEKHLERQGRPVAVNIKLRWVMPH